MADLYAGPCRVTVVLGERRLDVGLPGDVPLAELLSPLAASIGLPDRGRAGWTLRRSTGPALDSGLSVADLGLRHGEVLHLRPLQETGPVLWVDDVVDAISTATAELPARWSPPAGRAVARVTLAAALAGGAAAIVGAGTGTIPALVAGFGAAVLLVAAAVADRALAQPTLAALVGVAAAGYAAVAGLRATGATGPGVWALAAAAALVACAAGAVAAPAAGPGFAAAATVALLGLAGWSAAALLSGPAADGAGSAPAAPGAAGAAALALGLLLAPLFPMAAFRLSPLPMPFLPTGRSELAEGGGEIGYAQVFAGTLRADGLLTGLVAGAATTVAAAAVELAGRPGWAPVALLAAGAVALVLRARHHRGLAQRLWWYGAGMVLAGLLVAALAIHSGQMGRLALAAALLGLAVVAGSVASQAGGRPRPRLGRLVDLVEVLAVVALLPLALELLGVYARVRALGG